LGGDGWVGGLWECVCCGCVVGVGGVGGVWCVGRCGVGGVWWVVLWGMGGVVMRGRVGVVVCGCGDVVWV
jgi:hypothetical protein